METRNIGITLLIILLALVPSDRVEGSGGLVFYQGYAVFDFGPSLGAAGEAPDAVTMEAHARPCASTAAPSGQACHFS